MDLLAVGFILIATFTGLVGFSLGLHGLSGDTKQAREVAPSDRDAFPGHRDTIGAVAALPSSRPPARGVEDWETCQALVESRAIAGAWRDGDKVELPSGILFTQDQVKEFAAQPRPRAFELHTGAQRVSTITKWESVHESIERKKPLFLNAVQSPPQEISLPPLPEPPQGPPHLQREFKAECECPWGHFGIHTFELGEGYGILYRVCSDESCGKEWTESSG